MRSLERGGERVEGLELAAFDCFGASLVAAGSKEILPLSVKWEGVT